MTRGGSGGSSVMGDLGPVDSKDFQKVNTTCTAVGAVVKVSLDDMTLVGRG